MFAEKASHMICESVEEGCGEQERNMEVLEGKVDKVTRKLLDLGLGVESPFVTKLLNTMNNYATEQGTI